MWLRVIFDTSSHNIYFDWSIVVIRNERNNYIQCSKLQYIYHSSSTVSLWRTRHSTALPPPRRIIKAGRRRKATVPSSSLCPSRSFSDCPFMRVAIVMRWEWRTVWHHHHRPCPSWARVPQPRYRRHARKMRIVESLIRFVAGTSVVIIPPS